MARPKKTGLEYFPLNCQMNDKIDMLEAEHGLVGFAVYIKLLQLVYQTNAGKLDMSNVFRWKTLGKKWELDEKSLQKLVNTMCEIGLFDKNSFEEHQLLTSDGVQKRLGKVASLREKDRLRHGKADSNEAESFSSGKPAENAGKSTQRESKGKVNTTAVAVVGEHAATDFDSNIENQRSIELPADEAPVFTAAGFAAFVSKMQYGHINKGRYLIDIQRKAESQRPRTNTGWENYILAWLKRDLETGHLLTSTSAVTHSHGTAHTATIASRSYDKQSLITNQSKPVI